MTGVRVTSIDPRDQLWEDDAPAFRVHFWHDDSTSDEYELTEADIDEVLAWAHEHSRGRTITVWLVQREESGVGLIRLAGVEPPAPLDTWPFWARPLR